MNVNFKALWRNTSISTALGLAFLLTSLLPCFAIPQDAFADKLQNSNTQGETSKVISSAKEIAGMYNYVLAANRNMLTASVGSFFKCTVWPIFTLKNISNDPACSDSNSDTKRDTKIDSKPQVVSDQKNKVVDGKNENIARPLFVSVEQSVSKNENANENKKANTPATRPVSDSISGLSQNMINTFRSLALEVFFQSARSLENKINSLEERQRNLESQQFVRGVQNQGQGATVYSGGYSVNAGGPSIDDITRSVTNLETSLTSSGAVFNNILVMSGELSDALLTNPIVEGSILLSDNLSAPATTTNKLYAQGGDLYYAGNLIGGATTGNWASDGTSVWRTSGNVGIGTSTPVSKLSVYTGDVVDNSVVISSFRGATVNTAQFINVATPSSFAGAGMSGFTFGLPTGADQRLGFLTFGSKNGGSGSDLNAVGITGYAESAWTAGVSHPSYLRFETTGSGSASRTERMRITSAGNVGIGVSNPTEKLDVNGNIALPALLDSSIYVKTLIAGGQRGGDLTLSAGNSNTGGGDKMGSLFLNAGGANQSGGSGGIIQFSTWNGVINTSGVRTPRMTITQAGNIGIGTTTPSAKLAVVGTAGNNDMLAIASSTGATALVVKANGNVGIGTTTPGYPLTVSSAAGYSAFFTGKVGIGAAPNNLSTLSLGGSNPDLRFVNTGSASSQIKANNGNLTVITNDGGSNSMIWAQSGFVGLGSFSNPASRLSVSGNTAIGSSYFTTPAPTNGLIVEGNVGIGTTTPAGKLAVVGESGVSSITAINSVGTKVFDIANNGAITIGGNLNTASGALTFSPVGVEAMRINTAGNVGIGTTTPTIQYMKLVLSGGGMRIGTTAGDDFGYQLVRDASGVLGAPNSLVFRAEQSGGAGYSFQTNTGSSLLQITNSGNVGIGTSTPDKQLTLASSTSSTRIGLASDGIFFSRTSDNTYSGSITTPYNLNPAKQTLRIDNREGVQLSYNSSGRLQVQSAGVIIGNGAINANIGDALTPLHVVGTSYFNGNVGIGSSSPSSLLTLSTSSNDPQMLTLLNTGGGTRPYISYVMQGAGVHWTSGFVQNGTNAFGVMEPSRGTTPFVINDQTVTGLLTLGCPSTGSCFGNVGIGTTTPAARLAITGSGTGTGLAFQIADSTNSPTVTVLDNGNVGVNATVLSSALFTIRSKSVNTNPFSIQNASSTTIFRVYNTVSGGAGGGLASVMDNAGIEQVRLIASGNSYFNGGNLGIGTTTPAEMLTIVGKTLTRASTNATNIFAVQNVTGANAFYVDTLSTNGGTIGIYNGNSGDIILQGNASTGNAIFNNANTVGGAIDIQTRGTSALYIKENGNIGIGTTTPAANIHIQNATAGIRLTDSLGFGSIKMSSGAIRIGAQDASGSYINFDPNGATTITSRVTVGTANLGGDPGDFSAGSNNSARMMFRKFGSLNRPVLELYGIGNSLAVQIPLHSASSTYFNAGNNFGIGTTTPGQLLTVAGTIQSTDLLGGATTLSTDANGNIIRTPSDQKLKTNVETLTSSLDKVKQLRGVSYKWIDEARFGSSPEIGLIAQEVQTVVPEVVKDGGDYLSVNYQNLVALLIEAIKELVAKVEHFAKEFRTEKLCIGETCVTEDQLKVLLQNQNLAPTTSTTSTTSTTPSSSTSDGDTSGDSTDEEVNATSTTSSTSTTNTDTIDEHDSTGLGSDTEGSEQGQDESAVSADTEGSTTENTQPDTGADSSDTGSETNES